MSPFVSVIIPAYNASKYIVETVQSVLSQTHQNFEIIIVNDGSKDNTLEIINTLASNDNRIKIIDKTNTGVSDTRNCGIKISTGEYLAFLDADDVWLEDSLKERLDIFNKDISIGLVHSDCQIINEFSIPQNIYYRGIEGYILIDLLRKRRCCIPTPSSALIKREVIQKIGEWDSLFSTSADHDFFLRIANKYKIGKVNKILFYYRIHPNNMHKNVAVMEKDIIGVFQKADKNDLFYSWVFKQKCFANLYLTIAGSWWVEGENKARGLFFILKAFFTFPPTIFKKIISRL
jgi:glycosyltransferase involved in cell wall biosynthesis